MLETNLMQVTNPSWDLSPADVLEAVMKSQSTKHSLADIAAQDRLERLAVAAQQGGDPISVKKILKV